MKEVKSETADKKSSADFFDENTYEYSPLQNFDGSLTMSPPKDEDNLSAEPQPLNNYLRQAFMFFPGTFLLFYVSLATAGVLTDVLKNSGSQFIFEPQLIFVYLLGLISVFLTWFGLGDLKNKKHLVIPGSIIFSGALLGFFISLTDNIFWLSRQLIIDFGYAVWLFPIALIVPFLAKGLVDKKSE